MPTWTTIIFSLDKHFKKITIEVYRKQPKQTKNSFCYIIHVYKRNYHLYTLTATMVAQNVRFFSSKSKHIYHPYLIYQHVISLLLFFGSIM